MVLVQYTGLDNWESLLRFTIKSVCTDNITLCNNTALLSSETHFHPRASKTAVLSQGYLCATRCVCLAEGMGPFGFKT